MIFPQTGLLRITRNDTINPMNITPRQQILFIAAIMLLAYIAFLACFYYVTALQE